MAEFVQCRLEEALPELLELKRVQLFTPQEIKIVVKKRKKFEYKLQRSKKNKNDYLNYIQYEMGFLALIKKRREKIRYFSKKNDIDVPISRNINKLFKACIFRFQADEKLWFTHMEFLKKIGWKVAVSKMYARMLQVHSHKPGLWVAAAKWEMEGVNSPETARQLLLRGLRFHKDSKLLYQEYFRFELMFAELARKIKEDSENTTETRISPTPVAEGKLASVVYSNAIKEIPDVELACSFVGIAREFDFASSIICQIYKDLKHKFKNEELAWAVRAEARLNDKKAFKDQDQMNDEEELSDEGKFIKIFEKAVVKLNTEKMWDLYALACLRRIENCGNDIRALQWLKQTLSVYERAPVLNEQHYERWANIFATTGEIEEAGDVLENATKTHPTSIPLWCMRINNLVARGSTEILEVFNESLKCISKADSMPIWKIVLHQLIENNPEEVDQVFQQGLYMPHSVASELKCMYLEWVILYRGLQKGRKFYDNFWNASPVCLEFFLKMSEYENEQIMPSIQWIRKVNEHAISYYGNSNVDLWLQNVKTEQEHPEGDPYRISLIYWKAVKALKPELVDEFISQYTVANKKPSTDSDITSVSSSV